MAEIETCPSACVERNHPGREHNPEQDGCYCSTPCEMGPTCPGALAQGMPDAGCYRMAENEHTAENDAGPKRIQRKRTKGWRMPEGAIYVGRPTIFGNPFEVFKTECCGFWDVRDDNGVTYLVDHDATHRDGCAPHWAKSYATRQAVRLFSDDLTYWLGGRMSYDPDVAAAIKALRGHDLACWCPLDQPCHADVLLEIANGAVS